MKKRILGLLVGAMALVLVLAGCGQKSSQNSAKLVTSKTLTIGLEGTYAPYSYREDGKLKGFEVDLGKDLAKEMGLKVKFMPTQFDSLVAGVQSNKFDMIINNMGITKARQKKFLFSTPYIYSQSVLITKSNNTKIKSVHDLKGVKMVEGTGTDNWIQAEKFGGKIVSSPEFATSMNMLRDGRAQATINSKEAFAYYVKQKSGADLKATDISTKDIPATKEGIMMNKDNTGLQKQTNKALEKLRQNGTLKKLSEKYFGTDITEK
ncbi:amino acid ABC transporter substrate-binding component [Lactobacillus selangorensis]|uniref:Amino acid ABC transporter substrate-binding component n=1 Tax=Lactobacillus selangorensis TaxID=81857 RepID=A0A0R2G3X0_9LACO|nr:transporter substrate-binding domain-containing protein [Lactobacillus selangorensis]KRN28737.1 amino acid ABC transporter substrate-binding component [Lactobacillus selangorensis]KRN32853.1 amino acid ABC transporter substrate-binding component [Lactobacillus selangorensis]